MPGHTATDLANRDVRPAAGSQRKPHHLHTRGSQSPLGQCCAVSGVTVLYLTVGQCCTVPGMTTVPGVATVPDCETMMYCTWRHCTDGVPYLTEAMPHCTWRLTKMKSMMIVCTTTAMMMTTATPLSCSGGPGPEGGASVLTGSYSGYLEVFERLTNRICEYQQLVP
jgi:hypothetical protein